MPLYLHIDPRNGYPVYLQIVEQVRRAVAIGALRPGDQLPTGKQLAAELVINPATISRAVRELERLGIIEVLPGRGAFVASAGDNAAAQASASDVVARQLEATAREAHALGIPEHQVRALADDAIKRSYGEARTPEEV